MLAEGRNALVENHWLKVVIICGKGEMEEGRERAGDRSFSS